MAGVDAGALEAEALRGEDKVKYEVNEQSYERDGLSKLFPNRLQLLSVLGGQEGVLEELDVDAAQGIDEAELEARGLRWGFNATHIAKRSFVHFMLSAANDFTLIMLIITAFLSLSLGVSISEFAADTGGAGYVEGTSILIAVTIIIIFTAINENYKDHQFAELAAALQNEEVTVLRASSLDIQQVPANDLVVGDIVHVFRGAVVPADGLLLGDPCKMNELEVTGEADDVRKSYSHDPFIMRGSHVAEGRVVMVVVAVGDSTYLARKRARDARRSVDEHTSLQNKLANLGKQVGKLGLAIAVVLVSVLSAKYLITRVVKGDSIDNEAIERMTEYILTGLTLTVVSVPEGLPFSVTLAIAFSIIRMVGEHNMVRNLSSVETMGRCSEVVIDLTGAVTVNHMILDQGYIAGKQFAIADYQDYDFSSLARPWGQLSLEPDEDAMADSVLGLLQHSLFLNSRAAIIAPDIDILAEDDDDLIVGADGVTRKYYGNETEISLLKFGTALSSKFGTYEELRHAYHGHTVATFPFDPVAKWSAVLLRLDAPLSSAFRTGRPSLFSDSRSSDSYGHASLRGDERYRLYVKGAAELLLGFCTRIVDENGEVVNIVPFQHKLRKMIKAWTHAGRRVLTLAYKDIGFRPPPDVADADVTEMVCLGIVGISDSLLPSVRGEIRAAQQAGVMVRLVTGESLPRAITLARKISIYNPEYHLAMDSFEYNKMTNDELKSMVPTLTILARATPDDKLRIISQLQSDFGAVVAVTGGDLADRRSLIAADVGFAMGVSGSGVAREAADIVLLSDDFGSIVNTIRWGRNVFSSIRKFLQFQFTCNVVTVLITIIGSVTNSRGEPPISPVGLLWVNLIMDTFAAIALASDSPSPDLLRKTKPVSSSENVVTRVMMMHIFGQAAYQLLMLLLVLFIGPAFFTVERYRRKHFTLVFNAHVMMTLFNFFNVRSVFQQQNVVSGLGRNYYFWAVLLFSGAVQGAIVTIGGSWTKTEPLGPLQWASCLVLGAGTLLVGAFLRTIPTRGILLESKDIHDSPKDRAEKSALPFG
ncbi:plasma membrane calcium ATPase [Thecamonas trahens ATCC 50062]|uniref:Plasma membrane calcium ATPase n=1 Tax=Thecamonas trahens ATCC 50062 TaxID=461836 RepID=A0A0L0DC36_THETB|nr:plasma membrane calcium ATPase [Thecamonas trahens ATCC 50062]KNC49800.1 plasma membrane calcium ATPase [Thecamonas trahens ATCC 50062]|eukprot:XP_013757584.1 plasma membrane calcium ATPase [Thecamonas trahens ATCC 50062]